MEVFEITCIYLDQKECISHCGIKGYGVQHIALVESLISKKICSFFVSNGEKRTEVHKIKSLDGKIFFTYKPNSSKFIELDFLPQYDKSQLSLLRELVY